MPRGYGGFMTFSPLIVNNRTHYNDGELLVFGLGLQKLKHCLLLSDYDTSPQTGNRVELYWWN